MGMGVRKEGSEREGERRGGTYSLLVFVFCTLLYWPPLLKKKKIHIISNYQMSYLSMGDEDSGAARCLKVNGQAGGHEARWRTGQSKQSG